MLKSLGNKKRIVSLVLRVTIVTWRCSRVLDEVPKKLNGPWPTMEKATCTTMNKHTRT